MNQTKKIIFQKHKSLKKKNFFSSLTQQRQQKKVNKNIKNNCNLCFILFVSFVFFIERSKIKKKILLLFLERCVVVVVVC